MFLEGREELLQHFCTGILLSVATKSLKVTDLNTSMCKTIIYTAKNATDLMQVVDFTDLMQFANKLLITKPVDFIKLHQVCEHQTCCNLIFADLLQVDVADLHQA